MGLPYYKLACIVKIASGYAFFGYMWDLCKTSFGCITFRYDHLELHLLHSHCLCSCYHASFCGNMRWLGTLFIAISPSHAGRAYNSNHIDENLNFTFCAGRVWNPWTGSELKSWLKGWLSQVQGFPSMAQDNLTAFHKRFDIPDKKYRYLL